MSDFSLTDATLPVFIRGLTSLSAILSKAEADATARKIDPQVFLTARLAPDMFPLTRQVQILTDAAKGCASRLANQPVPSYPDTETTFAELQTRIKTTQTFVESILNQQPTPEISREITLKFGPQEFTLELVNYCLGVALPNFYFHFATTYDILRHNGVQLGKMDFLGAVPTQQAAA